MDPFFVMDLCASQRNEIISIHLVKE